MKRENIIDEDYLLNFGFEKADFGFELKISAIKMVCRQNSDRFYFELPGLYIGQIEKQDQLKALYYGLSGRVTHPQAIKAV